MAGKEKKLITLIKMVVQRLLNHTSRLGKVKGQNGTSSKHEQPLSPAALRCEMFREEKKEI